MTFGQAKEKASKALRAARQVYRQVDTAGEIVERTLDRLIEKRKTIVTPEQLLPLFQRYEDFARLVVQLERTLVEMANTLTRFVLKD